jgi:hypothetical protein
MVKTRSLTTDSAAALALKALAFVATDSGVLERLLAQSGLDAATLRERATEPHLQAAILDFLLTNEDLLLPFCGAEAIDPRTVHLAKHLLEDA